MTWFKDPPTAPGWYWCRIRGNSASSDLLIMDGWFTFAAFVHHEHQDKSKPLVMSCIWSYGGSLTGYEWQPLQPPKEEGP
jgi:hypothetical protein